MSKVICDVCKQPITNNTICQCHRTWYLNSNYVSWRDNSHPSGGLVSTTISNYLQYLEDGTWRYPNE